MSMEPVLALENLRLELALADCTFPAVEDVTFEIAKGESAGLVGESGCGKSITALSLMRLIPTPPGKIVSGSIVLDGVDLLTVDDDTMREMRGRDISMIFQEPMTSLNPVMTIGR